MPTEEVIIRVMRDEDVPALVEIDAIASGSPRAEYLQGKARQALDSEHSMVVSLVAEHAGNVVGFVMGQVFVGEFGIPESVATLDTVGIHPESQGKGVGTRLMEEFVSHARKVGVERIRTMVHWDQWDLMRFFRATGFSPGTSIVLERST
jgi:predicted N-acetyltransferase YhbS